MRIDRLVLLLFLHTAIIQAKEHFFTVLIPSYNNKEWYKRNLDSVFEQKYSNYRVIYIDDCSSDGTGDLVESYINDCGKEHIVHLVKNTERVGKMANMYRVIHTLYDDAIIVELDGDDWLAGKYVLSRINDEYNKDNVWMTYGSFIRYPDKKRGCCQKIPDHVIRNNAYRSYRWCASHLRTYYAGLFKRIDVEDFKYDGKFMPMGFDLAYTFAMLEMAGERAHYIDDLLYVYNMNNPLNDFRLNQRLQEYLEQKIIRKRQPYQCLLLSQETCQ